MKKVVVIGSCNVDIVYEIDRMIALGETISGKNLKNFVGGKGLNQAVASQRINGNTIFLGSAGCGNNASFIKEKMKEEKLDIKYLKDSNKQTGTALISILNNDNMIVVISGANEDVDINYIKEYEYLLKDSIVLIQNEINQETNEYIINYCHENEIDLVYNPAPARKIDLSLIEKVKYFTPNESEASYIFEENDLEKIVLKYQDKVIITLGKDGVIFGSNNEVINFKPLNKVDVIDTTGAGDTLNGILCAYLANNNDFEKSLKMAIKGATMSTTKLGAQSGMPRKCEIENE